MVKAVDLADFTDDELVVELQRLSAERGAAELPFKEAQQRVTDELRRRDAAKKAGTMKEAIAALSPEDRLELLELLSAEG